MNLIHGQLADSRRVNALLDSLEGELAATLKKAPPDAQTVIDACDRLAATLPDAAVLPILAQLGMGEKEAEYRLKALRLEFSRAYLQERLARELGPGCGRPEKRRPRGLGKEVEERFYPLGVLFHIAAGNMDGLPAYSVIEGLLAGNINLLKLPATDGGLSVMILRRLIELEPALRDYVYVFELSSAEEEPLQKLARLAHAVVVWGGDAAVQSVRRLAPPNTRIIEWGHKLSFAYVTRQGMAKEKLKGLAHNICATNQLLCSSCQGVFVDTPRLAEAEEFCKVFLPVLEETTAEYPDIEPGVYARNSLQLYARQLEQVFGRCARIFRGKKCSITLEEDGALAAAAQYRNLWVKRLPAGRLVEKLYPCKSHLQTAALLCGPRQYGGLCEALWRAGVVRVTNGADMSSGYCGEAHDGVYPLRQYCRVVSARK